MVFYLEGDDAARSLLMDNGAVRGGRPVSFADLSTQHGHIIAAASHDEIAARHKDYTAITTQDFGWRTRNLPIIHPEVKTTSIAPALHLNLESGQRAGFSTCGWTRRVQGNVYIV